MRRVVAALFLLEALLCGLPASLFEAPHIDVKKQSVPHIASDVEQRVPSAPAVSKTEIKSESSHPFQSPLAGLTKTQSVQKHFGEMFSLDAEGPSSAWNFYFIPTYICHIGEAASQTGPPACTL